MHTYMHACINTCIGANVYVLALERSCPYFMNLGFILNGVTNINARLNIFPDTHLLRM